MVLLNECSNNIKNLKKFNFDEKKYIISIFEILFLKILFAIIIVLRESFPIETYILLKNKKKILKIL